MPKILVGLFSMLILFAVGGSALFFLALMRTQDKD